MSTKVAFIGLGAMGSKIAKRLSSKQPLFNFHVYDQSPTAIQSILSAKAKNIFNGKSLHETVSNSNYVMTCLPSSQHVKETVTACFENINNTNKHPFASSGCIWLDFTSGDAKTSQLISNEYFSNDDLSLYFMDSPVSGGPHGAEKGSIACMVGCDEQNKWIFDQCCNDILQYISPSPTLVGNVGSGHAVKCINNLLNVSNLLILSEGLKCINNNGIHIETALNVINASSGRSLMSQERYPKHIIEKDYFYDFQLGLMKKDVQNALNLMNNQSDNEYVISNTVNNLLQQAVDEFGCDADYTEAGKLYIDLTQIPKT